MKLMFASDIHGSAYWTQKTLERFEVEKADYLVLLGDLLYHGPRNPLPDGHDPQGVIKLLNSIKCQIIAIRGNCDSEVDQMMLEFPLTADYNILPFKGYKVVLTHGHLYDENHLPKSLTQGDIFVYGHVHIPIIKQVNGIHIFNPGSVALPKEGHPHTYGIFDDQGLQIKTFDGEVYL